MQSIFEYIIDYSSLNNSQEIESLLTACSEIAFTFDFNPSTKQCLISLTSEDELKLLKIPSSCKVVPRSQMYTS